MRNPDGTCNCDRCGVDVGAGGLTECAILSVMDVNGYGQTVMWCTETCVPEVLTPAAIAHRPVGITVYHREGAYDVKPKKPGKPT